MTIFTTIIAITIFVAVLKVIEVLQTEKTDIAERRRVVAEESRARRNG
jgi:hypothetical protein